ncbi:MAG: hypothetical protein EON60_07375 [Alphaproteobacteria bacterium]|nr:MAG: hypothetical protein EON60_07375 [Alphaproteobacteria bacterium]
MASPNPAIRARQHIALMQQTWSAETISEEGLSNLISQFHTVTDGLGGTYLSTLQEEQTQDTLVTATWYPDSVLPEAVVVLIWHRSTGRIEYAVTDGNWPEWLTEPVDYAKDAISMARARR